MVKNVNKIVKSVIISNCSYKNFEIYELYFLKKYEYKKNFIKKKRMIKKMIRN